MIALSIGADKSGRRILFINLSLELVSFIITQLNYIRVLMVFSHQTRQKMVLMSADNLLSCESKMVELNGDGCGLTCLCCTMGQNRLDRVTAALP